MRVILETLNPFHKRGFYAVPGLAMIAAVVVAILLVIALTAQVVFNAHFYRSHFKAPLHVPHTYKAVRVPPKLAASLPTTGSIYFQYFTIGTNDQDGLGSCQGWAFVKQASYAYNWNRQANGKHFHRFFSPRFAYDMVSAGQDQGSYLEQYPPIARTGIPRWITFPYGAYQVDFPVPILTPLYRLNMTEHQLFAEQGAGSGGVALVKQAIATHHTVNADFPVFPEYDQANDDGSTVILPGPGETDRGGHANTCVKFDDTHQNGDGTVGAVLCSNQWNNYAGVGSDGIRHSGPENGFIWFSYGFMGKEVWDAAVIHVSTAPFSGPLIHPKPHHSILYVPSHAPLHKAPKITHRVSLGTPKAGQKPQVVGIITGDTGVDISDSINRAAAAVGVSAPGYAALDGVESGIHQIAPHSPIAAWDYCDWSGGGTQVNVCTAQSLGVGDGTASLHNVFIVLSWEQGDANRDISWSGILLARMHRNVCWDFPWLYAAWNMGDGYGCSLVYRYPTNSITINAVRIYDGWWNWVWASHVRYGYPPGPHPTPKPKPHYSFPGRLWEQYRHKHHRSYIGHTYHHRLSQVASAWWTVQNRKGREVCGGILRRESWNARRRVMTTNFQGCKIWSWPTHHGWNPKVKRHRWIR